MRSGWSRRAGASRGRARGERRPSSRSRAPAAWPLESHSVGSEQRYDVTNQFYRKRIRLQWDRRLGRRGEGARAEETAPGFTSELRTIELKITLKMKFVMNLQLLPAGAGSARGWRSPPFRPYLNISCARSSVFCAALMGLGERRAAGWEWAGREPGWGGRRDEDGCLMDVPWTRPPRPVLP